MPSGSKKPLDQKISDKKYNFKLKLKLKVLVTALLIKNISAVPALKTVIL